MAFALHILPHRYVRIRHYGILSYHGRSRKITDLQKQQNYKPIIRQIIERPVPIIKCCKCHSTSMTIREIKPTKVREPWSNLEIQNLPDFHFPWWHQWCMRIAIANALIKDECLIVKNKDYVGALTINGKSSIAKI